MKVAILGLGTVGKGVYDLLLEQPDIDITYVLDHNADKTAFVETTVASSYDTILNDEKVDVVIELIGGIDSAYKMIVQAIIHGKHVVTANKAVMSRYFEELYKLAVKHSVQLLYEASVGGAIIVLDPLKTIASINQINAIEGIVNGATNFVLSNVFLNDMSLERAIQSAYDLGYLETGTTDDMDGLDAMRKINILSMLSYRTYLRETDVHVIPLSDVTETMIDYVKSINHELKYIATSKQTKDGIHMDVMPVVYPASNPYQLIQYEQNAITIHGTYHKAQTFIGQGAGRYPTASAVVYDLLQIKDHTVRKTSFNSYLGHLIKVKYRYLLETSKGYQITEPMTLSEVRNMADVFSIARWEGKL